MRAPCTFRICTAGPRRLHERRAGRKDTPYRRVEFARRRIITVEGHAIRVVSPEDLVLSKLAWATPSHRAMQLRDVRNLIGCVPDLDWQHLDRWARELDVAEPAGGGAAVTDTSPAMASLQRRLLMERPAEERLAMGCAMFDAARALMRAGLGIPPGTHLSPDARVRLFLRTYGRDFDAATAAGIIAHLGGAPADPGEWRPAALPAGPGRPQA